MTMALYRKAAISGITMIPWRENNLQAIVDAMDGTDLLFSRGILYANGERINKYDAVAQSEDGLTPKEKHSLTTLKAIAWEIEAIVWDTTNVDAIIAFVGQDKVVVAQDAGAGTPVLIIDGITYNSGDAVAFNCGDWYGKVTEATLAASYTIVT